MTSPVYTAHPRCADSDPENSNILCAALIAPASAVARRCNEGISHRVRRTPEVRRRTAAGKGKGGMQGKNKIRAAAAAVNGKLLRKAIRVISRDRRMAAVHEAGHIVVASSFGVLRQAWIVPVP
jgi:hypothetical protein